MFSNEYFLMVAFSCRNKKHFSLFSFSFSSAIKTFLSPLSTLLFLHFPDKPLGNVERPFCHACPEIEVL